MIENERLERIVKDTISTMLPTLIDYKKVGTQPDENGNISFTTHDFKYYSLLITNTVNVRINEADPATVDEFVAVILTPIQENLENYVIIGDKKEFLKELPEVFVMETDEAAKKYASENNEYFSKLFTRYVEIVETRRTITAQMVMERNTLTSTAVGFVAPILSTVMAYKKAVSEDAVVEDMDILRISLAVSKQVNHLLNIVAQPEIKDKYMSARLVRAEEGTDGYILNLAMYETEKVMAQADNFLFPETVATSGYNNDKELELFCKSYNYVEPTPVAEPTAVEGEVEMVECDCQECITPDEIASSQEIVQSLDTDGGEFDTEESAPACSDPQCDCQSGCDEEMVSETICEETLQPTFEPVDGANEEFENASVEGAIVEPTE